MGLPRVRQEEGDVSFLELSGQSSVCCLGRAPRIEGNPVVPELGFFFSFVPSPAPLSPCDLFGLKISFPNSLRAVFPFFFKPVCFCRSVLAELGFHWGPVPSTPQLGEMFGKEKERGKAKNCH